MTAMTRPIVSRMTRDEFVEWDAPSQLRWQLVDGEAVEIAPASRFHGTIQVELARLIANYLASCDDSGQVVAAPGVIPEIGAEFNFRIPDLAVTFEALRPAAYLDEPVVIVEVLSPSNESDTRRNVIAFKSIWSVREILLVRSSRVEAELLRRSQDGTWPAAPILLRSDADLTLESIGFVTPLAALYRLTGLAR